MDDSKNHITVNVTGNHAEDNRQYELTISALEQKNRELEEKRKSDADGYQLKIKRLELAIKVLGLLAAVLGLVATVLAFIHPSDEDSLTSSSPLADLPALSEVPNERPHRVELLYDFKATNGDSYHNAIALSCMNEDHGKLVFNLNNRYRKMTFDVVVRDHLRNAMRAGEYGSYYIYLQGENEQYEEHRYRFYYENLPDFRAGPKHYELDLRGKTKLVIRGEGYSEVFAIANAQIA